MFTVVNPRREMWPELAARPRQEESAEIEGIVLSIIERVRVGGDEALRAITSEIDRVDLADLQVSREDIDASYNAVPGNLKMAIEVARKNIYAFHCAQKSATVEVETAPGVKCIQRSVPLNRVGLYIPGGSAPLFSTVLMLAVPAKIAGCREIILCSPPGKDGKVAPEILYAASICGVDRIYAVGGAQAIAAMACGTESISKCDKIAGPGNRFVTKAKQIVSLRDTAIDMPAGPSEVMVIADMTACPEFVAADLLSQAEHGADSQVILVCDNAGFAVRVEKEIERQKAYLSRRHIIDRSLEYSKIIVLDNLDDMVEFAELYAPEHLILSLKEPWSAAERITAAGSVFVGNYSPESAGDYASGTNHTLPTSGWARSFSGVNADTFRRKMTFQEIKPEGLKNIGDAILTMSAAEGLDAHGNAVKVRLEAAGSDKKN